MTTGWKYIRNDGEEFKSKIRAAVSLDESPDSTFIFSELNMAGTHIRDATEEIRACYAGIIASRKGTQEAL